MALPHRCFTNPRPTYDRFNIPYYIQTHPEGGAGILVKSSYIWLFRKASRILRHRRLRDRPWWRRLTKPLFQRQLWKPCRDSVAIGSAIGAFFAVTPLPLQTIAAALVAMKCKGNVPFALGLCLLSNPFTNLPIWTAQLWLGNLIQSHLPVPVPSFLSNMDTTLPGLGPVNAGGFIVGSVASSCLLAAGAFLLVHGFAAVFPRYLPIKPRPSKIPDSTRHEPSI